MENITQDVSVFVKGYKAKCYPPVKCYCKDSFTLYVNIVPFVQSSTACMFDVGLNGEPMELGDGVDVDLFIESPEKVDHKVNDVTIENGQVKIALTSELTNKTGTWTIQMVITQGNSRRTIPPFSYEVKATTDNEWNGETTRYVTLRAEEEEVIIVLEDGNLIRL